jgi:hypothetical protein
MEALAGLFAFASLIVTLSWALTFFGPTRRAIARGILAPYHIPLRRARWVLGLSAVAAFITFGVIAPPENQSSPSGSASTASTEASPTTLETPAPKVWGSERPAEPPAISELQKENEQMEQAQAPTPAETTAPPEETTANFTTEQFESARRIFCETERNVLGQEMANAITNRPTMNSDVMIINTIGQAAEKAHTELGLSETDAVQLMDQMMKKYPDIGHARSMAEGIKACQEYSEDDE